MIDEYVYFESKLLKNIKRKFTLIRVYFVLCTASRKSGRRGASNWKF